MPAVALADTTPSIGVSVEDAVLQELLDELAIGLLEG